MRTRDINYLNMVLAVKKTMAAHEAEIATRKMLGEKVKLMNKVLSTIQRHHSEAEVSSKGATKLKKDTATAAVELALTLAGSAVEYAKNKKDAIKEAQFSLTTRDFNVVEGLTAVARLRELIKHLKEGATELEAWDVSKSEVDTLENLTNMLNEQMANPRQSIINRKSHNDTVQEGLNKLREIMDSMDNLMSKFKGTEFMIQYEAARIIINLGTRKRKDKKDENDKGTDREVA